MIEFLKVYVSIVGATLNVSTSILAEPIVDLGIPISGI